MELIAKNLQVWLVPGICEQLGFYAISLVDSIGKGMVMGGPGWGREKAVFISLMSRNFSKNFQTNVEEAFVKANSYNPGNVFINKYLVAHTYMYG